MNEKISYIKNFPNQLRLLEPAAKGKWGKGNRGKREENRETERESRAFVLLPLSLSTELGE